MRSPPWSRILITRLQPVRRFGSIREQKYEGYWNLILQQPHRILTPTNLKSSISTITSFQNDYDKETFQSPNPVEVKAKIDIDEYLIRAGLKPIGPKPLPPGSEDCCMSGCSICVYDIYKEELEMWAARRIASLNALISKGYVIPNELELDKNNHGDDKRNFQERAQNQVEEELSKTMNANMRAFWELERKLKKKDEKLKE